MAERIGKDALAIAGIERLQRGYQAATGLYRHREYTIRVIDEYADLRRCRPGGFGAQLMCIQAFFVQVKERSVECHLSDMHASIWIAPPAQFNRVERGGVEGDGR